MALCCAFDLVSLAAVTGVPLKLLGVGDVGNVPTIMGVAALEVALDTRVEASPSPYVSSRNVLADIICASDTSDDDMDCKTSSLSEASAICVPRLWKRTSSDICVSPRCDFDPRIV